MDITPHIKSDRQIIQSYSETGFQISKTRFETPVIVFPDKVIPLTDISTPEDLDESILAPVLKQGDSLDLVIIGMGKEFYLMPDPLRQRFEQAGLGLEVMDTGAACRTYNVLLTEARRLAAILFPA
ncbi:MAG: Mth938-like domain-containing protein [Pseudomonadota bacterium]